MSILLLLTIGISWVGKIYKLFMFVLKEVGMSKRSKN